MALRQIIREVKQGALYTVFFVAVIVLCTLGVLFIIDLAGTPDAEGCSDIPDGHDLIISSGDTYKLAAGEVHEYESILIQKGGVLEIYGDKPTWTTLRCKGDFQLQGKIVFTGFNPDYYNTQLPRIVKSRDGSQVFELPEFSYVKPNSGGKGGSGGRMTECKLGSCLSMSKILGSKGSSGVGGTGGAGMSRTQINKCNSTGSCKSCYLLNGSNHPTLTLKDTMNCEFFEDPDPVNYSPGVGGPGGSNGKLGGLLHIVTCGSFLGTGGEIDVSGKQGGKGKDGESNKYTGGGGGGGGPGGHAGMIYFDVAGVYEPGTTNISGGGGGKGGKGGSPHPQYGLAGYDGKDGATGSAGKDGEVKEKDR
ncbi:MAG: hypothetical protein WDO14_12765 [Bacteroidota bacterium]